MKAKQLSVFLENKSGRLTEVTEALGAAGINLSAMSIADNSDFGILRCIVSDPDKAYQVLKAAHFAVKITDVIGFVCPNTSGSLSVVLKHLSDNGVFIEYMYSFPTATWPTWSSVRRTRSSARRFWQRKRWS